MQTESGFSIDRKDNLNCTPRPPERCCGGVQGMLVFSLDPAAMQSIAVGTMLSLVDASGVVNEYDSIRNQ
jgi:hypothetical protein